MVRQWRPSSEESDRSRWTKVLWLVVAIVTAVFLAGCDRAKPTPPDGVTVRLDDGAVWLRGYEGDVLLSPDQTVELYWYDSMWADEEQAATLHIGADDQLWLYTSSDFRLLAPLPPVNRPVLRLLQGRLRYRTDGTDYALGAYLEVPADLRIQVSDLVVAPMAAGTELEIWIEGNVIQLGVLTGAVEARGNGLSATLSAAWRAIVHLDEPMEVIPPPSPVTPMPTVSSTPTATTRRPLPFTATPSHSPTPQSAPIGTLTPTVTPTPLDTATIAPTPMDMATATPTSRPTRRPTPLPSGTPMPTATAPFPSETPTPVPPPPPPPPTWTQPPPPPPTALPPTATPPPPTATPLPPTATTPPTERPPVPTEPLTPSPPPTATERPPAPTEPSP